VCISTNQPDTTSNPKLNSTTKQHAIVNIQLNIVACPIRNPDKFIPEKILLHVFVPTSVVIVTLPHLERVTLEQTDGVVAADDFATCLQVPQPIRPTAGSAAAERDWIIRSGSASESTTST